MIAPCLNPRCETGDPIRSFPNPFYCGSACEDAHKQLLQAGPPRREDVVRVPVQDEYARVAESYRWLWDTVNAELDERLVAVFADATPSTPPIPATYEEVARWLAAVADPPPPPEPVKVSPEQWAAMKAAYPPAKPDYGFGGQIGSLIGVPVEIVKPDPTPKQGWLKRLLRRLFG